MKQHKKVKIRKNSSKITLSKNIKLYLLNSHNFIKSYLEINEDFKITDLLFNSKFSWLFCILLLVAEVILNLWIINKIKYTEIDWKAYMSQVEGFLNGTRDYSHLKGDTGPLVYPAGFLYIYSVFYYITTSGANIRIAQYLFSCLYLITLSVIFRIYVTSTKLPPYAYIFMSCIAYRIHSIYLLRLFNDPVAMTFFYTSVLLFINNHWLIGCILYSIAVSIKMNILLSAPGLLILFLQFHSIYRTFLYLTVCAFVQLVLGLPFLLSHPTNYLSLAFNFKRVFLYEWTVNWRFLSEEIFLDRRFHLALIIIHLTILLYFIIFKWSNQRYKIIISTKRISAGELNETDRDHILYVLFTSNFVGVVISRSLHYQFYSWYFHTLLYLLWKASYFPSAMLCVLGLIELCWNVYPSTAWSSALLHICHLLIMIKL